MSLRTGLNMKYVQRSTDTPVRTEYNTLSQYIYTKINPIKINNITKINKVSEPKLVKHK